MKWTLFNCEFQYEEFIHMQFIYPKYGGAHTEKEWRQKTSSSRHCCIFFLFLWAQEAEQNSSWHKEIIALPNLTKNGIMIHPVFLALLTGDEPCSISILI